MSTMIHPRDETCNHLRNPQGHENTKHTAQVLTHTNGHYNNNRQNHGNQSGIMIIVVVIIMLWWPFGGAV
jgi:hypothetical protein